MNERKIYIEHKLNNGKTWKETIYCCLWRQCVDDENGTTAKSWDNKHECRRCNGYNTSCKKYVGE